jgi:hypothetical protein
MNQRGHRLFLCGLFCLGGISGLLFGCSSSGTPASATAATGASGSGSHAPATITGVATPTSVSVVTAN